MAHSHELLSSGWSYAAAGGFVLLIAAAAMFGRVLVGADGRTSTSKVQAFLWTIAVAFAVISLVLQDRDVDIPTQYLGLLGFPALALMLAKATVQEKLSSGTIAKPPPPPTTGRSPEAYLADARQALTNLEGVAARLNPPASAAGAGARAPDATTVQTAAQASSEVVQSASQALAPARRWWSWLGDIVNDDAGKADVVDFQYLVFNVVALIFFFVELFDDRKFPDIPTSLLVLTGVSATTYVGNKLTLDQQPVITAVTPVAAPIGDAVTVRGSNLGAQGTNPDGTVARALVKLANQATGAVTTIGAATANVAGATFNVPSATNDFGPADYQLSVVNGLGLESNQLPLKVQPARQ